MYRPLKVPPTKYRGILARFRGNTPTSSMDSPQRVVLDMDSTEIPVYGEQEQSAYNGHFESTCYHPLLLFNGEGDCLGAKLRPGNVHSAEDWEEVLLPEIERQQELGKEVVFRADAAFAKPEIYKVRQVPPRAAAPERNARLAALCAPTRPGTFDYRNRLLKVPPYYVGFLLQLVPTKEWLTLSMQGLWSKADVGHRAKEYLSSLVILA
jgi:Transposase DDE domain group 1